MSRNSSSTDVCETLHSRRHLPKEYVAYLAFQKKMPNRAEIRFRAKTVVTSLPRDIYKLLGTCRIPQPARDEVFVAPKGTSKHVIVAYKNEVIL